MAGELAAFPRGDSATADALTYRDMTTSPAGQRITLVGTVERTEERMWAAGVRD